MPAPKPSSNITQTNKVELSPEQKDVFNLALPKIKQYGESTPELMEGSQVAGFTPEQLAGQQYAMGVSAPTAAGLSQQAAGTQSQLMDPNFMLNPNEYLDKAADAVTKKGSTNFLEQIMPGIRSGAQTSGGQYSGGSTREGIATGLAAGKSADAVSNALADMYFKNYTAGMGGLQNAVQGNQGVMNSQLMPANIANAVGGQKQALAQQQLDEETAKFYAEQDMPLLQSQQIMGLIGQMPGATGVGTVTGAMPQTNPFMQAAGMGLSLLGGMNGMPMGMK